MDHEGNAMIAWIIYFLAAWGIAWGVGHARASRGIREWLFEHAALLVDLVECPGCLGFYIGLGFGIVQGLGVINSIFLAFATTGSNVIIGHLTGYMPKEE